MGDHLKKNNYAVYGSKNRGSSKRSSYGSDADERALRLAEYIVAEKATVRAAAKAFSVSKSTVHKDITPGKIYAFIIGNRSAVYF